jgi:hypothetical protein
MLKVVVTDIDGNAVAGVPLRVEIEGVLRSERHRADAEIVDPQSCDLESTTAPVLCPFRRRDFDTDYTAIARAKDRRGREVATQYEIPWYSFGTRERDLAIVPDRASYRPGEIAGLEIQSTI